jgi:hypothetical protein
LFIAYSGPAGEVLAVDVHFRGQSQAVKPGEIDRSPGYAIKPGAIMGHILAEGVLGRQVGQANPD